MRGSVQIKILAHPREDRDFIEWMDTAERGQRSTRYCLLGAVRAALREVPVDAEYLAYVYEEKRQSADKKKRRTTGQTSHTEMKWREFRIALHRSEHSDIVEKWANSPRYIKSQIFIELWRIGSKRLGERELLLPRSESAPVAEPDETIIASEPGRRSVNLDDLLRSAEQPGGRTEHIDD